MGAQVQVALVGMEWSQYETVFASYVYFIYQTFLYITEIIFHTNKMLTIKINTLTYKFNVIFIQSTIKKFWKECCVKNKFVQKTLFSKAIQYEIDAIDK